jgi:hypothetical protein
MLPAFLIAAIWTAREPMTAGLRWVARHGAALAAVAVLVAGLGAAQVGVVWNRAAIDLPLLTDAACPEIIPIERASPEVFYGCGLHAAWRLEPLALWESARHGPAAQHVAQVLLAVTVACAALWLHARARRETDRDPVDDTSQFVDTDAATQAQYSQLALSGAMAAALQPYPTEHFPAWFRLVNKISAAGLPTIHTTASEDGSSRFDQAYQSTHSGEAPSFLAEFQFAFVSWLVSQSTAVPDENAFTRWRHLVLATYNAGERRMTQAPDLFAGLVDSLMAQYDLLPDEWFTPDSFIASRQADYLAEDMIDSDIPGLVEKGQAFAAYLRQRRG